MIRIWEDPWLPISKAHSARSTMRILDKEVKVRGLVDVNTTWWKTELVKEVFNEEEANMICSLGVSPCRGKDFLAWEHTKNGVFTVRSAYHLAIERFGKEEGSCSNTHQTQALWKQIWGLKGSRVVKLFLWKACNDILPTREKLFKKKIVSDPLCAICGRGRKHQDMFGGIVFQPRMFGQNAMANYRKLPVGK